MNGDVVSTPLSIKLLSLAPTSRHLDSNQKGGYVKSGRSGAHKPDKFGLGCEVNKCSDAGTEGLGVLPTQETLPCLGEADSKLPRSKFK